MGTNIHSILKHYWGYEKFRPLQEEIITSFLEGNDVLALLPTGGGKSICFQVPALVKEGICIVISPLIALMKDQVINLKRRGVQAEAIYSGMHRQEIDVLLDNCVYGDIKFLYVSPERLQTEIFQERLRKMNVSMLAIDEAHCISQWGHEFRKPYTQINLIKEIVGEIPMIALTASATSKVREDIIAQLELKNPTFFSKSFFRPNLSYSCFEEENKERKLLSILQNVKGSSVVYANTRNRTVEIYNILRKNRISCEFYHGGLTNEERNKKQDRWIKNDIRVIVATNAFGMGIDKPDVRTVIHWEPPVSIEAYYQEAGRAGRDEEKAYCVLLYNQEDIERLTKQFEDHYPKIDLIKRVYQSLANYYKMAVGGSKMISYDFDLADFCKVFNLTKGIAFHAIKRLETEGYLLLNSSFFESSKLKMNVDSHSLYKFQVANPTYDSLVKAILRAHGGEVFTQYIRFSEENITKMLNDTTQRDIIKKLEYMHKSGILAYYPRKSKPQITFLRGRVAASDLVIDKQNWNQLKETEEEKLSEMLHYIQSTRCRSLSIQYYFGEDTSFKCGSCDQCLLEKRSDDYEEIKRKYFVEQLEDAFNSSSELKLEQLVKLVNESDQDAFLQYVRELLDMEELEYLEKEGVYKRK